MSFHAYGTHIYIYMYLNLVGCYCNFLHGCIAAIARSIQLTRIKSSSMYVAYIIHEAYEKQNFRVALTVASRNIHAYMHAYIRTWLHYFIQIHGNNDGGNVQTVFGVRKIHTTYRKKEENQQSAQHLLREWVSEGERKSKWDKMHGIRSLKQCNRMRSKASAKATKRNRQIFPKTNQTNTHAHAHAHTDIVCAQ